MFNNDKHELVNKFVKTLTERAEQSGGGLSYALNYVYSLLMDMDLNAENWRHINRETVTLQTLIDIAEQEGTKNMEKHS
jgi:hypothetical protein